MGSVIFRCVLCRGRFGGRSVLFRGLFFVRVVLVWLNDMRGVEGGLVRGNLFAVTVYLFVQLCVCLEWWYVGSGWRVFAQLRGVLRGAGLRIQTTVCVFFCQTSMLLRGVLACSRRDLLAGGRGVSSLGRLRRCCGELRWLCGPVGGVWGWACRGGAGLRRGLGFVWAGVGLVWCGVAVCSFWGFLFFLGCFGVCVVFGCCARDGLFSGVGGGGGRWPFGARGRRGWVWVGGCLGGVGQLYSCWGARGCMRCLWRWLVVRICDRVGVVSVCLLAWFTFGAGHRVGGGGNLAATVVWVWMFINGVQEYGVRLYRVVPTGSSHRGTWQLMFVGAWERPGGVVVVETRGGGLLGPLVGCS